jgi:menaquinol-cytochrome c reductase cytochrome b subunit
MAETRRRITDPVLPDGQVRARSPRGLYRIAYAWLDERTGIRSLVRKGLYEAVPRRGAWAYTLGSATLLLIVNQLITGIFLTMIYVPSTTEGWESLNWIRRHDEFASIVRGMHLWGAYVLLFVLGLHMVRTFFSGSYKRPRETNWLSGVVLFVLVLGLSITGAMLPWDQAAYWTAVVVTNIPSYTPVIGIYLRTLWRGGEFTGPITLLRTYGIHIWILPALLFTFIGIHLYLLRKHAEFGSYVNYRGFFRTLRPRSVIPGEEQEVWPEAVPPEQREMEPPYPGVPTDDEWAAPLETDDFYPDQTFKDAIVSLICIGIVFAFGIGIGAPLEAAATQNTTTYTPVPEWFYLPLDQLLVLAPKQLISLALWVPLAGLLLLAILPFVDCGRERNPFERPAVMIVGGLIVLFMLVLTALGSGRLFNL